LSLTITMMTMNYESHMGVGKGGTGLGLIGFIWLYILYPTYWIEAYVYCTVFYLGRYVRKGTWSCKDGDRG
jgi:hypothetical protein